MHLVRGSDAASCIPGNVSDILPGEGERAETGCAMIVGGASGSRSSVSTETGEGCVWTAFHNRSVSASNAALDTSTELCCRRCASTALWNRAWASAPSPATAISTASKRLVEAPSHSRLFSSRASSFSVRSSRAALFSSTDLDSSRCDSSTGAALPR